MSLWTSKPLLFSGVCLLLLIGILSLPRNTNAYTTSFETPQGFVLGDPIDGQDGWTDTSTSGTVSNFLPAHTGVQYLRNFKNNTSVNMERDFTAAATGKQCFYVYQATQEDLYTSYFSLRSNGCTTQIATFAANTGTERLYYNGTSYVGIGADTTYSAWDFYCIEWDADANWIMYSFKSTSTPQIARAINDADCIYLSATDHYAFDTFNETGPVAADDYTGGDMIWWYFPKDTCTDEPGCINGKYYLNNSEWTDYEVVVDLPANKLMDFMLVEVHSQDEQGRDWIDWQEFASTTEPTIEVINRQGRFSDGLYYSRAKIYGADYEPTFCESSADFANTCLFTEIASSSIISWYASSTYEHGTPFDYGPGTSTRFTSFEPASSSKDVVEGTNFIKRLWNTMMTSVFPFSTVNSINRIWNRIQQGTSTPVIIYMGDILDPDVKAAALGADDPVLFSKTTLNYGNYYDDYILKYMRYLVHFIFIIAFFTLILPRFGFFSIPKFGKDNESDTPKRIRYSSRRDVPIINLRR